MVSCRRRAEIIDVVGGTFRPYHEGENCAVEKEKSANQRVVAEKPFKGAVNSDWSHIEDEYVVRRGSEPS